MILDNHSYENDLKDFSFTFVELPKFKKELKDLKTIEDRWFYFLKHADESENIEEVIANHPEIKEAYDVLDRHHWSENDLQIYEKIFLNLADTHGMLEAAKKEGKEEGRKEGEAIGEKNSQLAIAKKMLKRGRPLLEIMEDTGLSEKELKDIKPKDK